MMSIKFKSLCLAVLCLFMLGETARAQTFSEWFSQKKTQQKYLLEQVAALKIYAGFLKKGYEISSSGLNFIKGASKGEFDLHGAFFSSLKTISPEISRSSKIADIIRMQIQIGKTFSLIENLELLGYGNQAYVKLVGSGLLTDCLGDIEELLLVITSKKLEMSDDERLRRIDHIYYAMQEKKTFALRFADAARSLAAGRGQELKTLKEMEEWYGNE